MLGVVKLTRNAIKRKFIYNAYRIALDGGGSWILSNDFDQNGVIFGVDNSSSKHSENGKNNILILGEGPSDDMNDSVGELGSFFYCCCFWVYTTGKMKAICTLITKNFL